MLSKVYKYIKEYKMIEPGETIIVGVSGGPDSMALLDILYKLQPVLGCSLVAAHLNHGLRPEAEAEESFVNEYCDNKGISCYSCLINVKELAQRDKKSLEEAGRECRYHYFSELAGEIGASRIATAHHRDDNAETVLLNIIRGSGIKGLRGIIPVNGMIIRPLLGVNRREIENYLAENSITYCIDQSNYSNDYMRNRLRHQLLPLLKQEYNPRIVESLTQLAAIAAGENEVIEMETQRLWKSIVIKEQVGEIILNADSFKKVHPAYQHRILLQVLYKLYGGSGWEGRDILQICNLIGKPGSNKGLRLKKGLHVNKAYNQVIFGFKPPVKTQFKYKVEIPGQVYIQEIEQSFAFYLLERGHFCPQKGDCYLDYARIQGELYLRSRQPGDFFSPQGMQGRKKIKDFFIDLKIPFKDRDRIPLLASSQEIYAVLGYRVSRRAAVDNSTNRILLIKTLPID